MNSALYSGWVQHRRHSPRAHAFRYRIGLLYLDLDEREAVLGLSPLAGSGRFAPFSFRERDYLCAYTANGQPLAEAARQLVAEALGERPEGRCACSPRCAAGAWPSTRRASTTATTPTAAWRPSSAR